MDMNYINDDEQLYRFNRRSYPDTWLNGKPTAALFIDPKGLSVQRDGNRPENIIIKNNKRRFRNDPLSGIVKVTALTCRRIKTYPKAIHNFKDKYHGEIHNSEDNTDIEITLKKAVMLADSCYIVYYKPPIQNQ